MEKKPLSKVFINLFGIGDFGFGMLAMVESYFFIAFMYSLGMDSAQVAIIGGVTSGFDVAWVFVSSMMLQGINLKWGKLRSWLLVAPPVIFIFIIMNYWGFSGAGIGASIIISIGFIVSHLAWNMTFAAHMAMVQAYTDDLSERATMSARKNMMMTLSNLAFAGIAVTILMQLTKGAPGPTAYTMLVIAMATIMLICYLILFAMTKPYEKDTRGLKAEEGGGENITMAKAIMTAVKNDQLWVAIVALLGANFAMMTGIGVLVYLFDGVFDNPAGMSIYGVCTGLAGFGGAFLAPFIAKAMGKKNGFILGSVLYAAAMLITRFVLINMGFVAFIAGVTVAGACIAISTGLGFALWADTVTYSVWKRGVAAAQFTMGIYSLPIKVAILGSRIMVPIILGAAGHTVGADSHVVKVPAALEAYKDLATLYPAIIVFACAIFLLLFYRLSDKRVIQMQEDLANNNAPFMKAGAAA
ncbi:MAG: MFS transporter [Actinomycetia bacterium]|nr:MFS transporter [Actinomycetes bacterium]